MFFLHKTVSKKNFHCYVQSILHSGLILDDDQDLILSNYSKEDAVNEQVLTKWDKCLLFCTIPTSFILRMCLQRQSIAAICFLCPNLWVGAKHLMHHLCENRQKRDLEDIVKLFKENIRVNNRVVCYYKEHAKETDIGTGFTKNMREFLKAFLSVQTELLICIMETLMKYSRLVPLIGENYQYWPEINIEELNKFNADDPIESCHILQRLCDASILLASNFLTVLALLLSPELGETFNVNLREIGGKVVPYIRSKILHSNQTLKTQFGDLKFSCIKTGGEIAMGKDLKATGLQRQTMEILLKSNQILQQSRELFHYVESMELDKINQRTTCQLIKKLHEKTSHFKDSLSICLEMYEIKANQAPTLPPAELNPPVPPPVEPEGLDLSLAPVEPLADEEYECYISEKDDSVAINHYNDEDELENRKFASVLSAELRLKLGKHQKFVAAREKRGILKSEAEEHKGRLQGKRKKRNIPPAPHFETVESPEIGPETVSTFLDSIRAASRRFEHKEDVFAD